ncbi:669_t:CDS:1, partial [Funneliformis geosporum]
NTAKDLSLVISDLTHCKEDLSMTSTEYVILLEQTSVGTSPVKSSIVNKQVLASESYENTDTECQKIPYN